MEKWIEPTEEQRQQSVIAQQELVEAMNRLAKEGMDPRIILVGAGAAVADLITCTFGFTAVPPWFERQAELSHSLIHSKH